MLFLSLSRVQCLDASSDAYNRKRYTPSLVFIPKNQGSLCELRYYGITYEFNARLCCVYPA